MRRARTVIAAALPLWRPAPERPAGPTGRLPRYAWIDPYAALRERLQALAERLRSEHGARSAVFVDSNHHVDREAAVRAGLAFYGKNTLAIVPGQGSFVALGALVTDAELEPAADLVPPGCGSCTLCLDACPTGALVEPGVLDATACISTTTQSRGAMPESHMQAPRGPGLRLRHLPGRVPVERGAGQAAGGARARGRGVGRPAGVARRARTPSCCSATSASTSRAAIPATCAATPWSRWGTWAATRCASSRRRTPRRTTSSWPRAARRALDRV